MPLGEVTAGKGVRSQDLLPWGPLLGACPYIFRSWGGAPGAASCPFYQGPQAQKASLLGELQSWFLKREGVKVDQRTCPPP